MTIRVLAKEDIPAVAALFRRVHPEHRGSSSEACESYFREMLFENPWRDPQVPYVGSRGERPHLRLLRSDGATDALPRTPDPRGGGLPVHGGLRLLADAWRHGAAAVRGRLEPRYAPELSLRHCWFQREGSWTLVHSRHADILAVIQQGDAFLSRLEGEWWQRWTDEYRSTGHGGVPPAALRGGRPPSPFGPSGSSRGLPAGPRAG